MKKTIVAAVCMFVVMFFAMDAFACAGYGAYCSLATWCCGDFDCQNNECVCPDSDFPSPCGDKCNGCSNGGKFYCNGGDSFCCPSGSPYYCAKLDGCVKSASDCQTCNDECDKLTYPKQCSGDELVWCDTGGTCNVKSGKSCFYGCNDLTLDCNPQIVCDDECDTPNKKFCDSSNVIGTCGNYDGDPCYELGNLMSCNCVNDACYDACDSLQCSGGDVYCYDSENIKTTKFDECGSTATDASAKYCQGQKLYYDNITTERGCSNGDCYENKKAPVAMYVQTCAESCFLGACIVLGCSNDCLLPGVKQCTDAMTIKTCGNFDDDLCLDLGNPQSCNCVNNACQVCNNQCLPADVFNSPYCENGVSTTCALDGNGCAKKVGQSCLYGCNALTGSCNPKPCVHECLPSGKKECLDANTLQTCKDYNDDDCYEWGDWQSCDCANSQCCSGSCVLGAIGCSNDLLQKFKCVAVNGCPTKSYTNCAADEKCASGVCQKKCSDACLPTQTGCETVSQAWSCVFNSSTKCYEKKFANCVGVKICQNGVCVCKENWQCGEWGACLNGGQTRTCSDVNKCGTTANEPAVTQGCSATCQILKGYWQSSEATDGDEVKPVVVDNGFCQGQTIEIEIWEKDWWILPDDFQIKNIWALTSPQTTASWIAVFEHEPANWFTSCEGPACLFAPEYYFKVKYLNQEVVNTDDEALLTVQPYYAAFTLEEFFDEMKAQIKEQNQLEEKTAYNQCLNFEGTITARCREMLDNAQVTPISEELSEAWQSFGAWWNKGKQLFDPGYVVIAAVACASCSFQGNVGAFLLEPNEFELGDILDGGVNADDFSYPKGLVGPAACGICAQGVWAIIDNPQLMIFAILKAAIGVGIKEISKAAGVKVVEYTIDDLGRGAKFSYELGENTYVEQLAFLTDDAGTVLLDRAAYENPIWIEVGGKDFVLFNALQGGPIIETSALSKAGKQTFSATFKQFRFQAAYENAKTLASDVASDKFDITKIIPVEKGIDKPYAKYFYGLNKVEFGVDVPAGYYGAGITTEDVIISSIEHEFGHLFQARGLIVKGYELKTLPPGIKNPVIEFFNDMGMLDWSSDPAKYQKVMRGKLDRVPELDQQNLIKKYLVAVGEGAQYQYELMQIRELAGRVGKPEIQAWVEKAFDLYAPGAKGTFLTESAKFKQAALKFNLEIRINKPPSTAFQELVTKYKPDWWEIAASGFEEEFALGATDVGVFAENETEQSEQKYLGCFENDVWWINFSDDSPQSVVQYCGAAEHCDKGKCVANETDLEPQIGNIDEYDVLSSSCHAKAYWFAYHVTNMLQIKSCVADFGDNTGLVNCDLETVLGGMVMLTAEHDYNFSGVYRVTMYVSLSNGNSFQASRNVEIAGCANGSGVTNSVLDATQFQVESNGCSATAYWWILYADQGLIQDCLFDFVENIVPCKIERIADTAVQLSASYQFGYDANFSVNGSFTYLPMQEKFMNGGTAEIAGCGDPGSSGYVTNYESESGGCAVSTATKPRTVAFFVAFLVAMFFALRRVKRN